MRLIKPCRHFVFCFVTAAMSSITTIRVDDESISVLDTELGPLTTFFTPTSLCETRWFHVSATSPGKVHTLSDFLGKNPTNTVKDFSVFNTQRNYFETCVPYSNPLPRYNPGVCPHGNTAASITRHEPCVPLSQKGTNRFY